MLEADANLSRAKEVEGYKVLPPCVLYGKIGQGGMGAVYRGRHLNLDIDVAVKCLKPDLTGEDEQFVVRFRREARSAARINHQNVVRVFDVSEEKGLHYIVMELVQGETARQRVQRKGQLAVGEALEIVFGAASGLGEAHSKGFIHRDIKPDNIMIASTGAVKVADLGLAKPSGGSNMSMLSGTNLIMGTPQYMPPEQWENTATVTCAADVWALGATLYYLLIGGEAIAKESLPAIMQRIVLQDFPDVREKRADVPEDVALFIKRATQKVPADRFADAREMAQAIEQLTTRRETLADNEAVSDGEQNTLLSPPPAKTLAKIKFWLDEQAQGGGSSSAAEDATMLSRQPRGAAKQGADRRGSGSRSTDEQPARSKAGLWGVLAVALLAVGALAIWQPWRSPLQSPFAEADALQQAGKFEQALLETNRVFAADAALPGKNTKLANLHFAWALQLRDRDDLQGSLDQLATSIALEPSNRASNLKRSVLAKAAMKVDGELQRIAPLAAPVPRSDVTTFQGRFASELGRELVLAGTAVELEADGLFTAQRKLQGSNSATVAVLLKTGDTITLAPWVVSYEPSGATTPAVSPSAEQPGANTGAKTTGSDVVQPQLLATPAGGAGIEFATEPARVELRGDRAVPLTIRAPEGAVVRVDGVVVPSVAGDGVHVYDVRSSLSEPNPVQVAVTVAGVESKRSVPVVRVPVALVFTRPAEFVGLQHAKDGKWATDLRKVQITGELREVATRLLVNGVAAKGLAWNGTTFSLTVPLQPGANRIQLVAERSTYEPVEQVLLVDRIDLPKLAVAEGTQAKASVSVESYVVAVDVDEWTTSVEVVNGKNTLRLLRDPNTQRFRGRIPLVLGLNRIVARAKNVLGKEARLPLEITLTTSLRRPAIRAVRVAIGGQQQDVRADRQVFLSDTAPLVIDTNDVNAVVRINDEPVTRNADGTIPLKQLLNESSVTQIEIVLENGLGRSDAFRFFAWLDSTKPTVEWLEPKSRSVARGKPFELSGTWADAGGLERDASKLGDLEVRLSPRGVAKTGTWSVEHPGLTESTTLYVEVIDRAGNATRMPLQVNVQ